MAYFTQRTITEISQNTDTLNTATQGSSVIIPRRDGVKFDVKELKIDVAKEELWTDSQLVLRYIRSNS